ncbi:T9SS type A sorting domain-containing protein [uncultured Prevotella sp.]|uniref:T9SS type A sorting domain-containing protein n=1 Tax=uncultured Prevotella sp. TaxID=159272 RepID=UPI00262E8897|nr:T9SS type A sorting domain-containing protein [uncultured Prevotella sp.]
MKKIMLLTILFCVNISILAQTKSIYQYDSNGNILSRKKSIAIIESQTNEKINDEISDNIIKYVTIRQNTEDNTIIINVIGNLDEKIEVCLYNTGSQLLKTDTFKNSEYTLDLNMFPSGVYLLNIRFLDQVYSRKIVIGK